MEREKCENYLQKVREIINVFTRLVEDLGDCRSELKNCRKELEYYRERMYKMYKALKNNNLNTVIRLLLEEFFLPDDRTPVLDNIKPITIEEKGYCKLYVEPIGGRKAGILICPDIGDPDHYLLFIILDRDDFEDVKEVAIAEEDHAKVEEVLKREGVI